jgi:hypothetical protein
LFAPNPLVFFTHPILTRPRVPARPAPINHGYCFLSSFFFQTLKAITVVVSFLHSFLNEREIDWLD